MVAVAAEDESIRPWIGKKIKLVWDTGKIAKFQDHDTGVQKWTCGHCDLTFNQWNHTKALVQCIGGPNIALCKKMSPAWRAVYQTIRSEKVIQKQRAALAKHNQQLDLQEHENEALVLMGHQLNQMDPPSLPPSAASSTLQHPLLPEMSDLSEHETPSVAAQMPRKRGSI